MLLLTPSVSGLFKWRQFEPEVILLAVGWYLRFSLSYREVEELLAERGLSVDHVTVWRWVESERPEADCVARARERDHSSRGANGRCHQSYRNRRLRTGIDSRRDLCSYVRTMGKDLVHVHVSDSNRALPGEARPRSTLNS